METDRAVLCEGVQAVQQKVPVCNCVALANGSRESDIGWPRAVSAKINHHLQSSSATQRRKAAQPAMTRCRCSACAPVLSASAMLHPPS